MKVGLTLAIALAANVLAATVTSAAPLEDYGKLPAVEMVELSPDGSRLAYVGAIKGERSVIVLQVGGEVLAATPLKGQAAEGLQWAGEDIVIVRSRRSIIGLHSTGVPLPFGSWMFQPSPIEEVTAIDLKHKTNQSLRETPAMKYYPWIGGPLTVRQIDQHWYAFLPGRPNRPNDPIFLPPADLYRVDLETGESKQVAAGQAKSSTWAIDAKGSVVAITSVDSTATGWIVRAPSSDKALARNDDGYDVMWTASLGRTPDTVVVGERTRNSEAYRLVKTDGSGSEPLQDQPLVKRLWVDPNTSQLIGYTAGGDQMKVTLFDAKLQARVQSAYKAFAGATPELASASADFSHMVVHTTAADDPGTYWLVDLTTGKAKPLGLSAPVDGAGLATSRVFDYTAADGLPLHGVLTLPAGSSGRGLPVVVMPNGPGEVRTRPVFDWWAEAFASRGYAVFRPNPRGGAGYGREFYEAGQGELGRKTLSDVTDGVRALTAAGIIDPYRLCLAGADVGGYEALAVLAKMKLSARCTVTFAAQTDLTDSLIEEDFYDMILKPPKGTKYVSTRPSPHSIEDVSPYVYRFNITSPVMFIHPKDDVEVPIKLSRDFAAALKKAGKSAEVVELDGSDHWMLEEQTRLAALKASVAFVERNSPAK